MKNLICLIIFCLKVASVLAQTPININEPLQCPKIVSVVQFSNGQSDWCQPSLYVNCSYNRGGQIQFSIDNGNNWYNSAYFQNIQSGFYNIKVKVIKNGVECIETYPDNPIYVASANNSNPPLIQGIKVSPIASCGAVAKVEVLPSNPGITMQYSLNGSTHQTSPIFNLPVGRYNLYYRKAGDVCFYIYKNDFVVYPQTWIDTAYYTVSKTCSSHTITVVASPSAGVDYSINNGATWQSSPIFTNVNPGYYKILCRKNNCIYTPVNNSLGLGKIEPIISNVTYTPAACDQNGMLSFNYFYYENEVEMSSWDITPHLANYYISYNNTNYTPIVNSGNQANFPIPPGTNRIYLKVEFYNASGTAIELTCYYYFDIPIATGTLPAPNYSKVNTQCLLSNGQISFVPANDPTLMYSIDNGTTWHSQGVFNNLNPGTYQLKTRNLAGYCTSPTVQVTLTNENLPPGFNQVTVQNVTDCNAANGMITINPSPGNGSPLVSINNGSTWTSNYVFSNLSSGSYQLKIKNTNGSCESAYPNNPVILTEPVPPVIVSVSSTNVTDCGANDGTITITANQGSFPVQYSIDNGATWHNNALFSGLASGNYHIKVRNNNGTCIVSHTGNPIVITAPIPPAINSVSKTNVTDCNGSDGSIQINATPGSGTIQYSIDNGASWHAQSLFNSLPPGNYVIKARNANGTCIVPYTNNPVVITAPLPPTITQVTMTNTTDCGVNDGTISIQAIQGSYPVEYSINDGVSWQTNNAFANLSPGNYKIKVRNNNGTCAIEYASNPIIIIGHTGPSIIGVSSSGVTDCDVNDASIAISAIPGEVSPIYSINNGTDWSVSNHFVQLSPGSYNIKVKNSNGTCVVTYNLNPVVITPIQPPQIQSVVSTACSDCQLSDGTIQINAIPGSFPMQYSIDNGVQWSSGAQFGQLSAGDYYVKVRNLNGTCIVDFPQNPVHITAPVAPVYISVISQNATNCNTSDGSIVINATQGSSNLEYSINNGQSYVQTNVFHNLAQGSYQIVIRNAGPTCAVVYPQNPVVISAPSAPSIVDVLVQQPQTCEQSVGAITITFTAGSDTPQFTIDGGLSWHSTPVFNNLGAGIYQAGIRNQDGSCVAINPDQIQIIPPLPPVYHNVQTDGLIGCTVGLASMTITASGSAGHEMEYSINGGVTWQSSPVFQSLVAGSYNIVLRYKNGSCVTPYSANPVILTQIPPPAISTVVKTDPVSCEDPNTGQLEVIASDVNGLALAYSIDNGQSWHPGNFFSNLPSGVYAVLVSNSLGCVSAFTQNPIVINTPSQPVIQQIQIDKLPDCGLSNGQLTILYTSSQDVEFSINNGITWQPSATFTNLAAGMYRILIRNIHGHCQNQLPQNPFILGQNIDFSIQQVHATQPSDCDKDDGVIEIVPTPPAGNYLFSINHGQTFIAVPKFENLSPGSYTTAIKKVGTDCIFMQPEPTILKSPNAPHVTNILITQPGCNGNTGTIEIFSNTEDSYFSIDSGQTWHSKGVFTGLDEGTYYIVIRLADGSCTTHYNDAVELKSTPPFKIQQVISIDNTNCQAPDGSITIVISHPNVVFSIDQGMTWQSSPVFTDLEAGEYFIVVHDTLTDCKVSYPIAVRINSTHQVTINQVNYRPTHNCDGLTAYIDIEAFGEDLEYSIDGGGHWSNEGLFSALTPGVYTLAVRKGFCVTYIDTLVFDPLMVIDLDSVHLRLPGSCSSGDGSITIYTNDPVHTSGYSVDNGVNWQSVSQFDSLNTGIYSLIAQSSQTCPFHLSQLALYPSATLLIDSVVVTQPLKCGVSDGTVSVYVDTIPGEIFLSIDYGQSWQSDGEFQNLSDGYYQVLVRWEGDTCLYVWPEIIHIESTNKPTIDTIIHSAAELCKAGSGVITIISTNSNVLYSIDGGQQWSSYGHFDQLQDGYYQVQIWDLVTGCLSDIDTIRLNNFVPTLEGNIEVFDATDCKGSDARIIITTDTVDQYDYSIDGGASWQTTNVFNGLNPGIYKAVLRNPVNGCVSIPSEIRIGWPGFDPNNVGITVESAYCGRPSGSISIDYVGKIESSINNGLTWENHLNYTQISGGTHYLIVRTEPNCVLNPGFEIIVPQLDSIPYSIESIQSPTCQGMSDGKIVLDIPRHLQNDVLINWPDQSHALTFEGPAGSYESVIYLGHCQEAFWFDIDSSEVPNIDWHPLMDTLLCDLSGVNYDFKADTLHFQWIINRTIQHTGPAYTFYEPANITLTVNDDRGCEIVDHWKLEKSEEARDFDFLVASEGVVQIPIVAVDITHPKVGETQWDYDATHVTQAQTIQNQLHLIYDVPGVYTISCVQRVGECVVGIAKTVRIFGSVDSLTIQPANHLVSSVRNISISPNPNNGVFKVSMDYFNPKPGKLLIYNFVGQLVHTEHLDPVFNYEEISLDLTATESIGMHTLIYTNVDGEVRWRNFIILK